jgi:hypothetical protein
MYRSVERQSTRRTHSVRNATNKGTHFLPSDASLTGCRDYTGIMLSGHFKIKNNMKQLITITYEFSM